MLQVNRYWPYVHWKHETMGSQAAGWMALTLSLFCGSTFTPFAKTLSGSLSPLVLLFISEILTLTFVSFSFGLLPMFRQLARCDRKTLVPLLLMGLCSGVAGPFLWFTGLEHTSAVNAIFFGKIELVFLLLLASFYIHERVTRTHLLASAVILAGVIIIALRGFTDGVNFQIGDLAIMGSAFCYALGSSIFRRRLSHLHPELAVLSRALVAISAFFLLSPFINHTLIGEAKAFPAYLLPTLFSFAFISRFLNTFTFYEAAEHLPLTIIYPVMMLDVVASAILAHFILGESLAWFHVVGGAFIIAGNLLLHRLGVHDDDQHLEQHAVERLAHRTS
jgi:drug/metabolite transporter (DMT)-like permease